MKVILFSTRLWKASGMRVGETPSLRNVGLASDIMDGETADIAEELPRVDPSHGVFLEALFTPEWRMDGSVHL
jgi:hypothetical protein